jgi:4-O-beta-D-mannosyl-D-glucose phosphorylase
MTKKDFKKRLAELTEAHEKLITRKNKKVKPGNGVYFRYKYPVVTAAHTPLDGTHGS